VLELMRKYAAPMDRESYIHFATQQSSRLDSGARDNAAARAARLEPIRGVQMTDKVVWNHLTAQELLGLRGSTRFRRSRFNARLKDAECNLDVS